MSSLAGYPSFDDWEVEQNLRRFQAQVGGNQNRAAARAPRETPPPMPAPQPQVAAPSERKRKAKRRPQRRIDAAHSAVREPHRPPTAQPKRTSFLGSLALAAFAAGGLLLGWSFVDPRAQLGSIGVPVAVAGQVGLLLGLVLQSERIWHNSRYAVGKLEHVDSQLHKLKQTTTMLGVTHGSASQAFYAHLANEADPDMLLADLKGQLDLLAVTLSKRSA